MLLALDQVFPRVCRSVLTQLVTRSFVPDVAEGRLVRVVQSGKRLADSSAPELILAALRTADVVLPARSGMRSPAPPRRFALRGRLAGPAASFRQKTSASPGTKDPGGVQQPRSATT